MNQENAGRFKAEDIKNKTRSLEMLNDDLQLELLLLLRERRANSLQAKGKESAMEVKYNTHQTKKEQQEESSVTAAHIRG